MFRWKTHTAETFPFLLSSLWNHSDGGHDSPSGYCCAPDTHVEADEYVLPLKYQSSATKGIFREKTHLKQISLKWKYILFYETSLRT